MVRQGHTSLHEDPNEGEVLEPEIRGTTGITGNKSPIICQRCLYLFRVSCFCVSFGTVF